MRYVIIIKEKYIKKIEDLMILSSSKNRSSFIYSLIDKEYDKLIKSQVKEDKLMDNKLLLDSLSPEQKMFAATKLIEYKDKDSFCPVCKGIISKCSCIKNGDLMKYIINQIKLDSDVN